MWTLVPVLLIVWILGLVTSFTVGGWIHLLPVAAIGLVVLALWRRRRQVSHRFR